MTLASTLGWVFGDSSPGESFFLSFFRGSLYIQGLAGGQGAGVDKPATFTSSDSLRFYSSWSSFFSPSQNLVCQARSVDSPYQQRKHLNI